MRRPLFLAALLAAVTLGCATAPEPTPLPAAAANVGTPSSTPPGTIREPGQPGGHVVLAGDSLTIQAGMAGQIPAWLDFARGLAGIGFQAEHTYNGDQTGGGMREVMGSPIRYPTCVVIALGSNDVATSMGRDGWTQEDRQQLRTLADAVPTAHVVWVLPHYAGPDGTQRAGIEAYRAWVAEQVTRHPGREHSFDWRPRVQPGDLEADGTHLTEAGRAAYGRTLAGAASTHCDTGLTVAQAEVMARLEAAGCTLLPTDPCATTITVDPTLAALDRIDWSDPAMVSTLERLHRD